jgi:hypothetical protein
MTANGRTLTLYWDGVQVAAVDYLGAINAPASPAWLSIGANLSDPPPTLMPPPFSGIVDDIGVWRRGLSEAEITSIYNGGLAGQSISQIAPVIVLGNCPPLANDDSATTQAGASVTINVLANDTDPDNNPLTVASRTFPDHGTNVINGDGTITYTPTPGYVGPDSFTYTISDGQGGRDTATVRITVTPAITCPANMVADAGAQCTAVVTFTAQGADSCTPASGSTFAVGATTVTCTGNGGACSFTVTVRDATAPQIACPPDMVAECSGNGEATVSYTATATDNCGNATVVCTPASGSVFSLGETTVNCTATDGAQNQSRCSFKVTVRDTTPPQIICPINTQVAPAGPNGTPVQFTPNASDSCGLGSVVCTPPSGSTFPLGTTTVTCSAVDGAGQARSCTFTITVGNPNDPPVCSAALAPDECVLTFGNDPRQYVLALDNATACIVLDGSASSDPDGDALSYTWTVDGVVVASSAMATVCLEAGCHTVELAVSDGTDTSVCRMEVCVIGAGDAVDQCVALVDDTEVARKNKRPLIASLKAAQASFDRGSVQSAMNQLKAFQNKVRAQIGKTDPAAAAAFAECVQAIIDAVNCSAEVEVQANQ